MINRQRGSNLTVMNTMYLRPEKQENGKYSKPIMVILYKDNETGLKHIKEILNPDYEYYKLKDDVLLENYELFIEKDKLEKITVDYISLEKDIAERTDNLDFYYDNIKSRNSYANKQLHKNIRIFNSDMNIEDHYRFRFSQLYQNDIIPITKSYIDIELDNRGANFNGIIEYGKYPINAVTIIMEHLNKTFTFLLRSEENPLIEKFEKNLNSDTFNRLKSFIKKQVGGVSYEKKYGLDNMEYQMLFYDDEILLINDVFKCINTYKPDFTMAWNMAFDIPYLIERIRKLGYKSEDIICHPDFKYKKTYYYIDERNINMFAERGDYALISSYTVFIDQMIHFASRRKGRGVYHSYSLDNIGEVTVNVKKADYKHITTDLSELPYLDYETFVFYNIMDTIVQKCIETKTGDIDYIFAKCLSNNTRYHKGHRQTIYLPNRANEEFLKDNFVLGNNQNTGGAVEKKKFPGAFVGDTTKVSDYGREKINDVPINVFRNCDDFDFKSLYPSVCREFNISPNTQIGMLIIENKIHNKENRFNYEYYNRGGSFLEDFQSEVWLEFGSRWFNLADYDILMKDIVEYFTTIVNPHRQLRQYNKDGTMVGLFYLNNNIPIKGLEYVDKNDSIKGLEYYKIPSNFNNIINDLKNI